MNGVPKEVGDSQMNNSRLFLGIDIGSVSVNLVLLNEQKEILLEKYIRHKGQPIETTINELDKLSKEIDLKKLWYAGVTGAGGRLFSKLLGVEFTNEVIAQAKGICLLHPEVKTVIEIGGEDSKLLIIEYDSESNEMLVKDFSMNAVCAAGTGSFLDQQASRLGISIEKFGELALKSKTPPRIAGRCSVFAKSDMIHLQQEAAPVEDIIAGLCFAVARNFKSSIGRGKKFGKPISFQGGVAANKGMVRAFKEVLKLKDEELIIPPYFASIGAVGAALVQIEKAHSSPMPMWNVEKLKKKFYTYEEPPGRILKPFSPNSIVDTKSLLRVERELGPEEQNVPAYLGIDIGSISTNLVVIDEEKRVLYRLYLMTAGRPIEAVRAGLSEIGDKIGKQLLIKGVGTTGSGRYMIGEFVGADIVKNEITAQARGALEIDPEVDTIFEIGGQDSKYISLERGAIIDFEMNKVCAAGTGSFLEEQAEKLGVNIKEEFADLAFSSKKPVFLGERCTVFMDSELVKQQQKGVAKEDLVAGLAYSIVYNYLNRVVENRKVGNKIFFQGGVANNKAVKAAFEEVTGKTIHIPPNFDVTGALGVAIIAKEHCEKKGITKSKFKGFDMGKKHYTITSFECQDCANNCEIRKVEVEDGTILYYGSRCEKYELKKIEKSGKKLDDLFLERELLLTKYYRKNRVKSGDIKIGFPRILNQYYELFPFWSAFFAELGIELVLSDPTIKHIIHQGVEAVVAETCFPIKVAHGHVLNLLKTKKIDYLFVPSIINMKQYNPHLSESFSCPYVQSIPYTLKSAINPEDYGVEMLNPPLYFKFGAKYLEEPLIKMASKFGKKASEVKKAIHKGLAVQEEFNKKLQERGKEILARLATNDKAVVIISRPYNGCDPGINLGLPQKLKDMGILAIPMDMLDLDNVDISIDWPNMYWRYGQKILCAVEIISRDPRLHALYISNFGCGPDSFIAHFFREKMGEKPYLLIEVDEHSADVGIITRCEAFLDSLENTKTKALEDTKRIKVISIKKGEKRIVYLPNMSDHARGIAGAFMANGVEAEVLPVPNEETIKWGRRYTSGKECYPAIITTGDMIRKVMSPDFDRKRSAFFMGGSSGPCRFGQYNMLQRLVLDELGFNDVPIYAPNQAKMFFSDLEIIGKDFFRLGWQGMVAIDILDKALREFRPYELRAGETEKVYQHFVEKVEKTLAKRGNLLSVMKEAADAFSQIPVDRSIEKPLIGVVGEFYVRNNAFSNENIVKHLESLGAEVWLPPVYEWFLYRNFRRNLFAKQERDMGTYLKTVIQNEIQIHDEHQLIKPFLNLLRNAEEPRTSEVLKMAAPYLHYTFFGEAIMSLGKAVDFFHKGICGIVNVIPFTCLPGTIASAVLKRFQEDHLNIPTVTISFDGLGQTNLDTRLEAFVYQAQQFKEQNKIFLTNNMKPSKSFFIS